MTEKIFKLSEEQIKPIIPTGRSCVASDKITVQGMPVGYMHRESPDFNSDSGWRLFSGTEDQLYVDNPNNLAVYDLNTIVNYDLTIIPYLDLPIGVHLERCLDNTFSIIES
jgi:hypothetical protein